MVLSFFFTVCTVAPAHPFSMRAIRLSILSMRLMTASLWAQFGETIATRQQTQNNALMNSVLDSQVAQLVQYMVCELPIIQGSSIPRALLAVVVVLVTCEL